MLMTRDASHGRGDSLGDSSPHQWPERHADAVTVWQLMTRDASHGHGDWSGDSSPQLMTTLWPVRAQ